MNRFFYAKLAWTNIKRNAKTYVPYMLTSIFTIAMHYVIMSLAQNEGILNLYGGAIIASTLSLGYWVTTLFAIIFLFYTNSFLMKRRKREFGLFNILGMEKKHLARVIGWETIIILVITLVFGILFAVLLDKVLYLIILRMLNAEVPMGFYISASALIKTGILFLAIYACIFLNSLRQIHLAKPIELLNSAQTGEREPKSKWLFTILGVLCLGTGYMLAITPLDPVSSIYFFLIAVILVIIGTYLLFTSCSIVFLKMLRKNKRYFYKTSHFISVSGMIYRMKQNAVGLANICILMTMVLVMVSSTTSLMLGMEDVKNTRYPYDFMVTYHGDDSFSKLETEHNQMIQSMKEEIQKEQLHITKEVSTQSLTFTALQENNAFTTDVDMMEGLLGDNLRCIFVMTIDAYNEENDESKTLNENEVLVYGNREDYAYDHFKIFDKDYTVVDKPSNFVDNPRMAATAYNTYYLIVKDNDELADLYQKQKAAYGEHASDYTISYDFNISEDVDTQLAFFEKFKYNGNTMEASNTWYYIESAAEGETELVAMFGGFFFIGIFLGSLFIMATILIIYYKQISEGYDDKKRFEIMQKVGMSHAEIKHSIHSQIMTVFFLPLITAGIHVAFAFPIISRILGLLNLTNTTLYIICTMVTFLVFALIYMAIFALTARSYYKIVSND